MFLIFQKIFFKTSFQHPCPHKKYKSAKDLLQSFKKKLTKNCCYNKKILFLFFKKSVAMKQTGLF
ncbi:hypothetical protein EFY79_03120 [Hanamia caeni]|uniref:Uncharacterized protein n=1 Tax=Hanamia caeni TaxID=2294116 RepID=A0A3M9NR95_9BACT|nr:hypothetical protein EFY79_03120 [Hanamia caeni]